MADKFGDPIKPLSVKSLSIGCPSKSETYLSIVGTDNREFCFDLTYGQLRLIAMQTAQRHGQLSTEDAA